MLKNLFLLSGEGISTALLHLWYENLLQLRVSDKVAHLKMFELMNPFLGRVEVKSDSSGNKKQLHMHIFLSSTLG
jgi:hypothetical protein